MSVVDGSYGHPLKPEEEATATHAGGLKLYGYQCGMLWGAALAAGAQSYRLYGPGPQAETGAILAAQRLVESFRALTKDEINCAEITNLSFQGQNLLKPILKFFVKGGPIGCFRLAARYASVAFSEIDSTLSNINFKTPTSPVSCAGLLAQKMGVSEMHTVMAAGLAGGIGLSGSACGALGAAIWIIGLNGRVEGVEDKVINSRIDDAVDRYLHSADFEFECSKIVGRKFVSVDDHAGYLHEGGCSGIIEALAVP